jgi:hypothetical protein
MESTIKFADWMAEHGFDAQHWSAELKRSLRQRYEREHPAKIVVDCRGCDWPQKTYRQEVTL